MSKDEIAVKFAELSGRAADINKRLKRDLGWNRFIPMSHRRHKKLQEFGLYDYVTKKYTLGSIHSGKAQSILKEMSQMLDK